MAKVTARFHGVQFTSEIGCKGMGKNFFGCRFEYTVRQGNSIAHALVEEGMRRLDDYFWVEDAPRKAKELADFDR
ncbi:hypothetical protein Gotri_003697 [Gossypium trilobum]|uniref:RNase H type-1 domain-containing protein n=1 Tax=Gossypium trilobum TaxID=34281 RepID=A0A7J9F2C4_9ROSI|nr:hypothetical protein [Gossypium trilobum]